MRPLPILFALALLWRAALCFWMVPGWEQAARREPQPDHYPSLARTLLTEGTLGYAPADGASPTTLRGPGFPLWLAAGSLLSGDGRWLAFWGSLPALLLALAAARVAARRFGDRSALYLFGILAFHPYAGFVSARVMADEFVAALGFGALLLFDRASDPARGRAAWTGLIGAGLLLGLQILTRISGLLFLVPIAVGGWLGKPRRASATTIVVAVALAGPALWSIRSSRLEGRFVFVQSLTAYNFWLGEAHDRYGAEWTSGWHHRRLMDLIGDAGGIPVERRARFNYTSLTPRENARLERGLARAARDHVAEEPLGYAGRVFRGLGLYWVRGQSPLRTTLYGTVVLPLLAMAGWGLWRGRRDERGLDRMAWICLATILLNNVAHAAVLPMARFGIHVYPHLAWLGALALRARPDRAPGVPAGQDGRARAAEAQPRA